MALLCKCAGSQATITPSQCTREFKWVVSEQRLFKKQLFVSLCAVRRNFEHHLCVRYCRKYLSHIGLYNVQEHRKIPATQSVKWNFPLNPRRSLRCLLSKRSILSIIPQLHRSARASITAVRNKSAAESAMAGFETNTNVLRNSQLTALVTCLPLFLLFCYKTGTLLSPHEYNSMCFLPHLLLC